MARDRIIQYINVVNVAFTEGSRSLGCCKGCLLPVRTDWIVLKLLQLIKEHSESTFMTVSVLLYLCVYCPIVYFSIPLACCVVFCIFMLSATVLAMSNALLTHTHHYMCSSSVSV